MSERTVNATGQAQEFTPTASPRADNEAPGPKNERQEDDSVDPPIFTTNTIIISQPQPQELNEASRRRPIPVNTSGWVSTPRSQLSALRGTDFLGSVEQLEIQEIVQLSTLLSKSNPGNQYRVRVPRAETIFLASEVSGEWQRDILGSSRGFTLNLLDPTGELAFTFKKNVSWGCLPCALHKMTVVCNDTIGSIEQNCTFISSSFTVYDESRKIVCYIYGPNVFSCCMYKDAQFQIISADSTHQIASVMHHWDHFALDYTLLLTVPANMKVKVKALLLGATFLMEYLYFQHLKNSSSR
ncbi:phospholipid scramblase 1 [Cephus cinctus]|uniref:Phospholipid scramblase n=1 Tax=Cephus cinctus TaxID=211228 RepID=A0AAJ7CCZ8_CEPCN|nr:phospholipid scramblase 1 [Cephus cinctus]